MRLFILICLMFGMLSCQKKQIPLPPKRTTQEISLGLIKASVPLTWKEQEREDKGLIYGDMDRRALVLLSQEKCESGRAYCIILTMQGIAKAGFNHLSAEDVFINDKMYTLLISHSNDVKIWTWMYYKDNQMFYFSCGGPETDLKLEKDCATMSSTLSIGDIGTDL